MRKLLIGFFSIIIILIGMGCASFHPKPEPGFDPINIESVVKGGMISKSPGMLAMPAISPDMLLKLNISSGNIYMTNLDGSDRRLIYDRTTDTLFDEMPEIEEADTTGLAEDQKKADDYIEEVRKKDAVKGAALSGLAAASAAGEEAAEGMRYIIDMAWSPSGEKVAALIYAPMSYKAIVYVIDMHTMAKTPVKKFYPPVIESGNRDQQSNNVIYACGVSWKNDNTVVYPYFEGQTFTEYYKLAEQNLDAEKEIILSENDIIKAYFAPVGGKVAFFKPGGEYAAKMTSPNSALDNYFSKLELWVGDADFSNAKKIEEGIHINKRVGWSRDGRYLAYVRDGKMTLSGSVGTLMYYDTMDESTHPVCNGNWLNTPLFSPKDEIYFFLFDNHIFKARITQNTE
jgi:hypothetical protein